MPPMEKELLKYGSPLKSHSMIGKIYERNKDKFRRKEYY